MNGELVEGPMSHVITDDQVLACTVRPSDAIVAEWVNRLSIYLNPDGAEVAAPKAWGGNLQFLRCAEPADAYVYLMTMEMRKVRARLEHELRKKEQEATWTKENP